MLSPKNLFVWSLLCVAFAQNRKLVDVKWCAAGSEGYAQCERLRMDIETNAVATRGRISVEMESPQDSFLAKLICIPVHNIFECAELLKEGYADVARFSAEELYGLTRSGQYSELVPVAAGVAGTEACPACAFVREYAVAAVRKTAGIEQLDDLRDRSACFESPGSASGWAVPLSQLHNDRVAPAAGSEGDGPRRSCLIDLDVAYSQFPSSCAPGSWATDSRFAERYADRLCASCVGRNQSCLADIAQNEPLRCLLDGRGDVAFLDSRTLTTYFDENKDEEVDYGLICGSELKDIHLAAHCNWATVPADVFLASKYPTKQLRPSPFIYGQFVRELYSTAKTNYYPSIEFLAAPWVSTVERIDRKSADIKDIESYLRSEGVTQLPVVQWAEFLTAMQQSFSACPNSDSMRLCVLSSDEMEKCRVMQMAFGAAGLTQSLGCVVGSSEENCVALINADRADVAVVAAHRADAFMHARKVRPVLEAVGGDDYAVAVALTSNRAQRLSDLDSDQLNVCSAGTDSFAGWEAPNRAFKQLGMIPTEQCRLTEEWARKFRQSCVPGAKNASVTLGRNESTPIDTSAVQSLCARCGGGGSRVGACLTPAEATDSQRRAFDMYYGDVGALRCLVKRNADVAFARASALTTVLELSRMGDPDFNRISLEDFVLLCADGKTKQFYHADTIKSCNLGKEPISWLVARDNVDTETMRQWQDFWRIALHRTRSRADWLRTYIHLTAGETTHLLNLIFSNTTTDFRLFPEHHLSEAQVHDLAFGDWQTPFVCGAATQLVSLFFVLVCSGVLFYLR